MKRAFVYELTRVQTFTESPSESRDQQEWPDHGAAALSNSR
jgi:hypothetical protein